MLKSYRVTGPIPIRGTKPGDVFEAEYPDEWIDRRIKSKNIEEVPTPEEAPEPESYAEKALWPALYESEVEDEPEKEEEA